MATIVENLPFRPYETTIKIPGSDAEETVLHRQIIVWLTLTTPDQFELPSVSLRFPAVLDPAFNESFIITQAQLRAWAEIEANELPAAEVPNVRVYDHIVTPRYANLWLHRNVPYERDELLDDPHPLEIDAGVIISPEDQRPRLPLLGLRAIEASRLRVIIDGDNQLVSIDSIE